jgi:hypothetical protein
MPGARSLRWQHQTLNPRQIRVRQLPRFCGIPHAAANGIDIRLKPRGRPRRKWVARRIIRDTSSPEPVEHQAPVQREIFNQRRTPPRPRPCPDDQILLILPPTCPLPWYIYIPSLIRNRLTSFRRIPVIQGDLVTLTKSDSRHSTEHLRFNHGHRTQTIGQCLSSLQKRDKVRSQR